MRWICLLSATLFVVAAEASPKIVAVFDIENSGAKLSKVALDRLNTYLTTKIAGMGYQVVPRAELQKRLRTQRRESYKACYDQSCQIEIGRELAAQKSVSTKILRLGNKCVVTMALYDLRKSATERAGDATGDCGIGGLVRSLEAAAAKLGSGMSAAGRYKVQGVVDRKHCPAKGMLRQGDPPPKGKFLYCVDAKTGLRNGPSINWHNNGKPMIIGSYRANKQHGLWTVFHRDGKKRSEVAYRNGKQEGPWIEWDMQGHKFQTGKYKDGRKVGLWTRWDNGQLHSKAQYKNDDRNGRYVEYSRSDGTKLREGFYRDGKRQGKWVYYRAGVKSSEGSYRNNEKAGIWTEYRKGAVWKKGPYKAGKRHGVWTQYFKRDSEVVTYREGKRHGSFTRRKAEGEIAAKGFYENDKSHGVWTMSNRTTITVATRRNGKLHGPYVVRRRDGQVMVKGQYRDNKRDGTWLFYSPRGGVWTLAREVEFSVGKIVKR